MTSKLTLLDCSKSIQKFLRSFIQEAELCSYYENEIKNQLKRQSAAHREHLSDVLQVQAAQLASEHEQNRNKEISTQKQMHVDELARVAAHLHGVESMIGSVVDVEKANRETRELWLAVQSLGSVLHEEGRQGRTRNLMPEILSIHKLAGQLFLSNSNTFKPFVVYPEESS